jgi:hypothetical protein
MVGHGQSPGDPLQDVEVGDSAGAVHDLADLALAKPHRLAHAGLARIRVDTEQPKETADVTTL